MFRVNSDLTRLLRQSQASFGRRAVALDVIARFAARDKIFPGGCAATRAGNHVIERKFPGR